MNEQTQRARTHTPHTFCQWASTNWKSSKKKAPKSNIASEQNKSQPKCLVFIDNGLLFVFGGVYVCVRQISSDCGR